jgi:hypothetical protein
VWTRKARQVHCVSLTRCTDRRLVLTELPTHPLTHLNSSSQERCIRVGRCKCISRYVYTCPFLMPQKQLRSAQKEELRRLIAQDGSERQLHKLVSDWNSREAEHSCPIDYRYLLRLRATLQKSPVQLWETGQRRPPRARLPWLQTTRFGRRPKSTTWLRSQWLAPVVVNV